VEVAAQALGHLVAHSGQSMSDIVERQVRTGDRGFLRGGGDRERGGNGVGSVGVATGMKWCYSVLATTATSKLTLAAQALSHLVTHGGQLVSDIVERQVRTTRGVGVGGRGCLSNVDMFAYDQDLHCVS
jgi:hypothetical protein